MLQMDTNRDGLVDFDEFVAATLHVHQLKETNAKKWQMRLQAAFDKFDFDGDGYITASELKIVWDCLLSLCFTSCILCFHVGSDPFQHL